MSLQVWLPLNGTTENLGLSTVTVTNNGATVNTSGKIGSCYSFDGNDYIAIDGLVLDNVWSYGCWFSEAASSRSWEGLVILNNNGGDADIQLGFYTYPGGTRIQTTANGQYNSGISQTYDGTWHHLFATFDGSSLKTYRDGILIDTKTITSALLQRSKLTLGARCRGSSYDCYYAGKINDFRLYDTCLSPQEVHDISQGLVLRYTLSDPYIENTTNILPQTREYSINTNPAWDKTLNGDYMFTPTGWGSGYNGGVTDPTNGYHARWIIDDLHGQIISNNLISSLVAGGRTTVSGNQVTTSGEDKDTYFYLQLGSALQLGHIYKLSCDAENVPSGYYWSFPIGAQTNTSVTFKIYNGYNEYYFIANSPCCQNAKVILDDNYRATVWQNQCIFKNFKLYEIKNTDDLVMHLPNKNSVINQKGRWLAHWSNSFNMVNKGLAADVKYTLSWEQKTTNVNLYSFGGLYYKLTSSGSDNFQDGYLYGYNTKVNTWEKMTKTFTIKSNYDGTSTDGRIYIYGHSSNEGDLYIRNVQLEVKDHATPYTEGGTSRTVSMAYDISGYANNGTSNGVTITPGGPKFNNSCKFNGSVNIITTSPCTEVRTLSIWVKWDSIPSYQSVVFLDGKSHLGLGLMSTGILCGTSGPGNYKTFSKANIVANTWYHFVVINPGDIAGVDRKLYINGVEQTPTANTSNWTYGIDQTQIGKRSTTSDGFVGELSDVSLYATALSADDVYNLYRYNRL